MSDHNEGITRKARPRIMFPAADFADWVAKFDEANNREAGNKPFDPDILIYLCMTTEGDWPVHEFNHEYWFSRRKELEKGTSETDRTRLRALRLLRYAFFGEEEQASLEIFDEAVNLLSKDPKLAWIKDTKGHGRDAAQRLYPLYFAKAMKRAEVRMWCKNGEWIPIIWCPDMTTAMFTYAAFKGVETCLNCQKLFCLDVPRVDDSRSEKYCTVACGQRFRQRIYRKRQAKEAKGKSR
jgi:hypothetical protein